MAKEKINALLKNNRYASVEKGQVFNRDSLLVLYDKSRRQALNERLSACELEAIVPPEVITPHSPPLAPDKCKRDDLDLVMQLKCLTNPQSPLSVSLWLDQPSKTQFNRQQKVTIGYQVNGLPEDTVAHFTLFNISPTGQLSMIFSEPVTVGTRYGQLTGDSSMTVVKQINLEAGEEYFKALVTSQPITESNFSMAMVEKLSQFQFWQTVDLRVTVTQ